MADITADDIMSRDEKLEKAEEHGITADVLFAELKDELEATETKFFQNKGKVIEKKDVIAWATRQNALEKGLRLLDLYPAEKHEHSGNVIFKSNVPEPDMPKEEEKKVSASPEPKKEEPMFYPEDKEENPLAAFEGENRILPKPIEPPYPEDKPGKEPKSPEQFKDHHKSRRDAGK